jgi:RNA polymerase sigma factor (sigma-70 family)
MMTNTATEPSFIRIAGTGLMTGAYAGRAPAERPPWSSLPEVPRVLAGDARRLDLADRLEARLETAERAAALQAALSALPDRQRLALVLRHLEERPNPEIAAILDTSVEAVESLLARGRRSLAAELAPRQAELGLADG